MPSLAGLGRISKFFGQTVSGAAEYAAGEAISKTLDPELQLFTNSAWENNPNRPLEAGDAAEIVAEDVQLLDWGRQEALQTGVNQARFDSLRNAVLNAPGIGELMTLWRRGAITQAQFVHGLRKARLETLWDTGLESLKTARYSPAEIALGVVRSVIKDPGWMVEQLDTSGSNVQQYEPVSIDPVAEAEASGFDSERMRGLVGSIGLPMSVVMAANAYFRGILTRGAYNQAVLEGDTRPEWADSILEASRQIPSVVNFVENHLRGYSGETDMNAGAARHGMSPDDAAILFQNAGRPLAIHQITTGLARGATFNPEPGELTDPYEAASHESDIKPSYYALNIANRYTYPSAFVIRQLAQAGELTEAQTEDTLLKLGWEPGFAKQIAAAWSAGGAAASKEATAADLLTLYDGGKATEAETMTALDALGYSPAEAQRKLDLVTARRVASAKGTGITDIHGDFKKGLLSGDAAIAGIKSLGIDEATATAIAEAWNAYNVALEAENT